MTKLGARYQPQTNHPAWHSTSRADTTRRLATTEQGLTTPEANRRLAEFGPNEIETDPGPSPIRILLEQYTSSVIWILIAAAGIMWFVGHHLDAAVILGIVVFITAFGFIQDYRAEQSIQALKDMAAPDAVVRRDSERRVIRASRVVPGDLVFVEAGDIVPADARLVDTSNLSVNEAALTGESIGVTKQPHTLNSDTPLADRTNMLYKDTVVERGSGWGLVVATGQATETGRIATTLQETPDPDTPFQAEMNRLGQIIAAGVIGIVAVIAFTELVVGDTPPFQVFLTAVGIAVSAVPEGLPAVVTLSLALGARRMAEKNALVRRLPIVEALGSVDVICTDKTGTLTEAEMTVTRLQVGQNTYTLTGTGYDTEGEIRHNDTPIPPDRVEPLLRCGMLCNNVEIGKRDTADGPPEPTYLGTPTEIAVFVAAQKAGLDHRQLNQRYPRLETIEFTATRKRMTTIHRTRGGDRMAFMKGAPETVLDRCTTARIDGETIPLTEERRTEIRDQFEAFAEDALRVLGFAYRPNLPEPVNDPETDMTFLGLQGMLDPPRPEVADAIDACHTAGVDVVMITGDNPTTARAIGRQIGLSTTAVITGPDLDTMTPDELRARLTDVTIFARTTPAHKTRILRSLQAAGHTVAMTGDGVNDAPAVKNADVGVAMGVRGTDVTEQASDIILLDDNFATIRDAVEEGRRIFDNVRKFVNYLLSGNGGEVTMIFTGSMAGFGLVVTPIQILWINVVTDGIPAVTMGVDPAASDVMTRPPRPRGEGVITNRIMTSIAGIAVFMTVCLFPLFYVHRADIVLAQTMVFTGFVAMEIVRIQAIRHRYGLGLLSNYWLVVAVIVAVSLQLIVLYTPTGQLLFTVEPLGINHWLQIGIATLVFAILMAGFVKIQDHYFDRY